MSLQSFEEILRATLDDYRLSRGERGILAGLARRNDGNEQDLALWRSRAFAIAAEQLVDPTVKGVLEWLEEVVKVLQPRADQPTTADEVLFTPGDDCPRRLGSLLRQTQGTADICVFTITDDRISDEILAAHKRGVKIRILTDNDKANDPGSDVDRLARAGISVKQDMTEYHMHHKFALFDSRLAVTGSYNWTRGAAQYNAENLLITNNTRIIFQFSEQFEKLWEEHLNVLGHELS